jgi:hypothetical protein
MVKQSHAWRARDIHRHIRCSSVSTEFALAFAPFPSYQDRISSRSAGAVKGAPFLRVHRSEAKNLDGEDERNKLIGEGKGAGALSGYGSMA